MVALVILNYKTYVDSYELIKSIYDNNLSDEVTVFLVDNETNEDELSKLKCLIKGFDSDVYFLPQESNLGFARGMNVGIDKAKESGFDFIVCSNNDVLIPAGFSFYELVAPYHDDNNIAWIGPQITNLDSVVQNPLYYTNPFGNILKQKLIKSIFLAPFLGQTLFIIRGLFKKFLMGAHVKSSADSISSGRVYSLHGSFFALTPAYFFYYNNMDSNTFLYCEELILSKRLETAGLTCYLNTLETVIHKEDSSTDAIFNNRKFRKSFFVLKENYRSLVYYLRHYI